MTPKKSDAILVVGADGSLGAALVDHLKQQGREVVPTSRRDGPAALDLETDAAHWPIPPGVTSACICAAVTSIDACRRFPREAQAVNVIGTTMLAKRLVSAGIRVVFPSSSLVFDGTQPRPRPETPPCPVTVYGRMKAEAETALLSLGSVVTVVRLSKVIIPKMPLFETWRQRLHARLPIHPFSDLHFAPVDLHTAATALSLACINDIGGILQLSATDEISYAAAARHLATSAGYDVNLVRPSSGRSAGLDPDHIVRHATLDTSRLAAQTGITPPSPWDALASVAKEWSTMAETSP